MRLNFVRSLPLSFSAEVLENVNAAFWQSNVNGMPRSNLPFPCCLLNNHQLPTMAISVWLWDKPSFQAASWHSPTLTVSKLFSISVPHSLSPHLLPTLGGTQATIGAVFWPHNCQSKIGAFVKLPYIFLDLGDSRFSLRVSNIFPGFSWVCILTQQLLPRFLQVCLLPFMVMILASTERVPSENMSSAPFPPLPIRGMDSPERLWSNFPGCLGARSDCETVPSWLIWLVPFALF